MWMLPLYLHVNQKSDYDMMMMMKSSADLYLTFTILWANSAGDKLMMLFFYFPENRF